MSKLLQEHFNLVYDKKIIKEFKDQSQPIVLKSILQRAESVNQNKRIYPRKILEREVENYKKAILENRSTGELDHPESSIVSLERISHVIRDIWWDNNEVWGKIEVLNTPKGKIVQELLESGISVGISSRGIGETNKDSEGNDIVSENFILVAFDLVAEPSTQNAWLTESKDISLDEIRRMVPKSDRVNRVLNDILKNK